MKKMFSYNKKIFFTLFSILATVGYGVFVFAAAPNGGYTPAQTLDPECAPGDVDCLVKLSSGISIGQTITGGTPKQVLYTDNAGNLFSDSNFVRDSATQETQILTNHTVTLSGGTVTITGLDFFYIYSISGTFIVGETITDTNSGATATLESFSTPNGNDSYFSLSNIIGTFSGNDSLVGNTSGATATIGQGFFNLFNIGDNVNIFSFPGGVPTPAGTGQVTNISGSTYTIQVLTGTLSNGDVLVNMTTGNSIVGVSNLTIPSSTLTTKSGYVSLADIGIGSGNQGTGLYTDNTTNTDKLFAGIVNGSKFGILSTISGVTSQYFLPSTDGSADQVLTTNGAGQVSWATVSSSISVTGNDTLYSSGLSGTGQDGSDNIFLGNSAGNGATNASYSNFLGLNAGYGATNAYNSNFLGSYAGNGATNASYSNFLGLNAGYSATSASNSNFLGENAGNSATNASYSNFLGLNAGYGATNAYNSNFLGSYAGYGATYANYSNFLGYYAGTYATNASNSNFLGENAGNSATNASYSNFLGLNAGYGATNASNSNFLGYFAGYGATGANKSNFFGYQAGQYATNANNSNFFGQNAGYLATNASYSNFFGSAAGYYATNAARSNFLGSNAGNGATNASYSNFFGQSAGYGATGAYNSNFLGQNAGASATNASYSNFLGSYAGNGATYANYSNFLGQSAGNGATNAQHSNFLGLSAGNGAINAYGSNFLGQSAGYSATGASNSIFIGKSAGNSDLVNNTGSPDNFSILIGPNTSTGNNGSGVGYSNSIALGGYATNTASNQFMIGSAARPINTLVLTGASGNTCTLDVTVASPSCSSDERLKTNVQDLTTDTLDKVLNIKTVSYTWNNFPDKGTQIGFLAQDLEQYFPSLVSDAPNGFKTVSYGGMTPVLVQAIREMNLKITTINDMATPNTWRDSLIAWFGNVENGIVKFFAGEIETKKLCIADDAGDKTCITKAQLDQLLMNTTNGSVIVPSSSPEPAPQDSPSDDSVDPSTDTPVPASDTEDTTVSTPDTSSDPVPSDTESVPDTGESSTATE